MEEKTIEERRGHGAMASRLRKPHILLKDSLCTAAARPISQEMLKMCIFSFLQVEIF
jgi:hypothetical protein